MRKYASHLIKFLGLTNTRCGDIPPYSNRILEYLGLRFTDAILHQARRSLKMAQIVKDNLVDLERHRVSLEQNIRKLRQSLQHWQAWEIEYEGLKEDIHGLEDGSDAGHLVCSLISIQQYYVL